MSYTRPTTARNLGLSCVTFLAALTVTATGAAADPPPRATLKVEQFDKDPGWEGFNNHLVPARLPTVTQDFGYSPATSFASRNKGEVGGSVARAARPAYYADKI